jgi:hypothetical protein
MSPARESVHPTIAERLLDSLEDLVREHRPLVLHPSPAGERVDLHAELSTGEARG